MAKKFYTEGYYKNSIVHIPKRKSFRDLKGKVIDKVTVLAWAGNVLGDNSRSAWWCICSCNPSKYFIVDAVSLSKGITKSCGCNYKNNNSGGRNVKFTKESASRDLPFNLSYVTFDGYNYPCEVYCTLCSKTTSFTKANHSRGFTCCNKEDVVAKNLSKWGFRREGSKGECLSCGIVRDLSSISSACFCSNLPDGNTPCGVYILKESSSELRKIGKSLSPIQRLIGVNKSASTHGYTFDIEDIIWVSGEKSAYRLESLLHQNFVNRNVQLPKFDGSCEVFDVTFEEIDNYLEGIEPVLVKLKLENYEPPFKPITDHYIDCSVEWCGMWYRSVNHLVESEKFSMVEYDLVKGFTNYKEVLNRINRYRVSSSFRQELVSEKLHGKDWGDGLYGTIRGIARKYKIDDGTLWHRVNKEGMSMKEALSLPTGNILHYWKIGRKYYHKDNLCKSLAVNRTAVTQRVGRGIPLKYALIPHRWKTTSSTDRIFIIDGNAFWWGDICTIFGITESFGKIYHTKYVNLVDYLEQWDLVPHDCSIEEVVFEGYTNTT